VRDKSRPVRRALEEQYAKIAEAQRNEDIEALRATRTPDFTVDLSNGIPDRSISRLHRERNSFAVSVDGARAVEFQGDGKEVRPYLILWYFSPFFSATAFSFRVEREA